MGTLDKQSQYASSIGAIGKLAARRDKQRGAVAIEFAAVFMIFFAVFYGTVSYGLPMLLMQSFNHAATEAVRHVIAINPTSTGFTTVQNDARAIVSQRLAWMPTGLGFNAAQHVTTTFSQGELTVIISYPSANVFQVIPKLVLPVIGDIPKLPTHLQVRSGIKLFECPGAGC